MTGGMDPGPTGGVEASFPGGAELEEIRAALLLQRLPGVGDVGLDALVVRFGSAPAAMSAPAGAFQAVAGPAAERARREPVLRKRVDDGLAWCRARGVAVVHRWSPSFPRQIASVTAPPGVLFLLGDRSLLEREIVTVVGSRKATGYGRRVAREVALTAVRAGAVVASGLALGIDGEAHRAALEGAGGTIAVLGSGLAQPHPPSHRRLFERIARKGLLVSEFLPGEPPFARNFPQRNRTLAALARVVVVVEAAAQSGALNTANHANDLGREVLAVPGPVDAFYSRGTNHLIRTSGATLLVSPEALLEHLDCVAELPSLLAPAPPPGLGEDALRVWDALAEEPHHVDEVARRARLAPARALVALSLLELAGWIRQQPGTRFSRSRYGP